jgi:hypothetical protein
MSCYLCLYLSIMFEKILFPRSLYSMQSSLHLYMLHTHICSLKLLKNIVLLILVDTLEFWLKLDDNNYRLITWWSACISMYITGWVGNLHPDRHLWNRMGNFCYVITQSDRLPCSHMGNPWGPCDDNIIQPYRCPSVHVGNPLW